MGTTKNVTGGCPYCGGNCNPHSNQGDDRYEKRRCLSCQRYSARKRDTFVNYPLVDPDDPESGWCVYNPDVEPART